MTLAEAIVVQRAVNRIYNFDEATILVEELNRYTSVYGFELCPLYEDKPVNNYWFCNIKDKYA